jgi:hypothetical protein
MEQQQGVILYMMSAYVPGIMSLGFPKMAVISLLTRLLLPGRVQTWLLWTMGIITILALGATVTLLMLECSPPRSLWDFSVTATCLDKHILVGLSFTAGCESIDEPWPVMVEQKLII